MVPNWWSFFCALQTLLVIAQMQLLQKYFPLLNSVHLKKKCACHLASQCSVLFFGVFSPPFGPVSLLPSVTGSAPTVDCIKWQSWRGVIACHWDLSLLTDGWTPLIHLRFHLRRDAKGQRSVTGRDGELQRQDRDIKWDQRRIRTEFRCTVRKGPSSVYRLNSRQPFHVANVR